MCLLRILSALRYTLNAKKMQVIGKYLIVMGVLLAAIGGILVLAGRMPWIGKMPGDVLVKRGDLTFYFPLATCILISAVLSFVFYLFFKR